MFNKSVSLFSIIMITAFATVIFVLLFIPFIYGNESGALHLCGGFGVNECRIYPPMTLPAFLQNNVQFDGINGGLLLTGLIGIFISFYIEASLLLSIIKPQRKKHKISSLLIKIAKIASMILIPLLIQIILSLFGIEINFLNIKL